MVTLGQDQHTLSLADRFEAEEGEFFLSGVQALVRLLLDRRRRDIAAGLKTAAFVCGYPGSPLGGFDRELERQQELLDELGVVHRPGLNEDLAATAVMGSQVASTFDQAQVDGVEGIWYGKAPGLDRAVDAMRHAVYAGASPLGGAVVLVGDDPASKSSTLPSASERLLAEMSIPVFFPGTMQEILDYGVHAVEMSARSGLWTALKMVTPVADGTGTADARDRVVPVDSLRTHADRVSGRQLSPPESNEVERRLGGWLDAAPGYGVKNQLNQIVVDPPHPWLVIVAGGYTYHQTVEALNAQGVGALGTCPTTDAASVKIGLLFPLDRAESGAGARRRRDAGGRREAAVPRTSHQRRPLWRTGLPTGARQAGRRPRPRAHSRLGHARGPPPGRALAPGPPAPRGRRRTQAAPEHRGPGGAPVPERVPERLLLFGLSPHDRSRRPTASASAPASAATAW